MAREQDVAALTGLRFVAAFFVFVFHLQIRWPLVTTPFFKNIIEQGAVGMSVFFMLSGFLLAYRYADGKTSYREFIKNRFARIFPVYVIAALVTLPWFGDVSTARALGLVASNIFLLQAWFPPLFHYWNNGASWSISVEAFCYALLPFILIRLLRLDNRGLLSVTILAYLAGSIPGIFATFYPTFLNKFLYVMPIFRLPEFTLGVGLYLLSSRGFFSTYRDWIPLAVLGVSLVYLGIVGKGMDLYVGHNWIVLPLIGLFLITLIRGYGGISRILGSRSFVWLGKISYCFYSFQALIILMLIDQRDALIASIPYLKNNCLLGIASFTVLLIISTLAYYCVEDPLRNKIRSRHAA